MDTAAQWPPQDIVVKPMEEVVSCSKERKVRPQKEQALNCPRCNSTNTKFCYYNNYSLSQPRYFCKTCRRYWTEGGSLRNIPVGGGSRKNKRSSKKLPDLVQNPNKTQDLNLGFSMHQEMVQLPNNNPSSSSSSSLELLTGLTTSIGLNSFIPVVSTSDPTTVYSSPFPNLPDFKPSLNFSLDGLGSNFATFQETSGKLLFPFEDLKQVSANTQQNRDSTGYWNGVMGGGSW